MNKTYLIFRQEIVTLVRRFSFWFGVLGVPLIGFLIISGIGYINQSQGGENPATNPMARVTDLFKPKEETRPQGYVDQAGLLKKLPDWLDQKQLIGYANIISSKNDLDAGKISAYYVIPADYIQSGKLLTFSEEFNLAGIESRSGEMRALIDYNLLDGDERLTRAVDQPLQHLEETNLAPKTGAEARDRNSELTFLLPYGVMMLFFMTIMGSSTMLLNSVAKEKENRIMEVLMISTSPHQLLMGKILGLGLVGLLQVVIWSGSALFLLNLGGQTFNLPPEFLLQPSILVWGVVFFVLGFLVYATLMAGVGALVPSLREASQATMVVMLPIMVPLFLLSALIPNPNGALSIGLSLFPLTAPTTMMMRLAATDVPLWQLLLAVVLLALTSLLVIRMVAGMFRAQTILSGQPMNIKRLFLALAGKG